MLNIFGACAAIGICLYAARNEKEPRYSAIIIAGGILMAAVVLL